MGRADRDILRCPASTSATEEILNLAVTAIGCASERIRHSAVALSVNPQYHFCMRAVSLTLAVLLSHSSILLGAAAFSAPVNFGGTVALEADGSNLTPLHLRIVGCHVGCREDPPSTPLPSSVAWSDVAVPQSGKMVSTEPSVLPSRWSGPQAKVVKVGNSTRLLIDGKQSLPVFLYLNTQSQVMADTWLKRPEKQQCADSSDSNAWCIFDYELLSASQSGIPIINVQLLTINNPAFTKVVVDHLKEYAPQAYVILSFELRELPELAPPIRLMSMTGATIDHPHFTAFSPDWFAQRKKTIARVLDAFDAAYPGKIVGLRLEYGWTDEWQAPICYASGPGTGCTSGMAYFPDYSPSMQSAFCQWMRRRYGLSSCALPTPLERSTTIAQSMLLSANHDDSGLRSILYNRFYSEQVADAIIQLAQEVKTHTEGKVLVLTSYGYWYEHATLGVAPGSGHLALDKVLLSPDIDAIIQPISYRHSRAVGTPLLPMGPADSIGLYGKLFIFEDDTRTALCTSGNYCKAGDPSISTSVGNTVGMMQRNIIGAAMHGSGLHFFDLLLKGWFGRPDRDSDSKQLWANIQQALAVSQEIRTEGGYRPQVAVFTDGNSLADLPLSPNVPLMGMTGDDFRKLQNDLTINAAYALANIGTSVRHYQLTDLGSDGFPAADIRMAVFLNAINIPLYIREAIRGKLERNGTTLVFIHASGVMSGFPDHPVFDSIAAITGLPVKGSFTRAPLRSTFYFEPANGTIGPASIKVAPWFYFDEKELRSAGAIPLGRYKDIPGSVVSAAYKNFGTHKVVYSGAPGLTSEMFRAIAKDAGVHLFTKSGTYVEAVGDTVMVYPSIGGTYTISLPTTAQQVIRRNGTQPQPMIKGTKQFSVPLNSGEPAVFQWQ